VTAGISPNRLVNDSVGLENRQLGIDAAEHRSPRSFHCMLARFGVTTPRPFWGGSEIPGIKGSDLDAFSRGEGTRRRA
jgi:hypothetical protein